MGRSAHSLAAGDATSEPRGRCAPIRRGERLRWRRSLAPGGLRAQRSGHVVSVPRRVRRAPSDRNQSRSSANVRSRSSERSSCAFSRSQATSCSLRCCRAVLERRTRPPYPRCRSPRIPCARSAPSRREPMVHLRALGTVGDPRARRRPRRVLLRACGERRRRRDRTRKDFRAARADAPVRRRRRWINADFFSLAAPPGVPTNLLVSRGRVITGPSAHPVLAFDSLGAPHLVDFHTEGTLETERATYPIAGWNRAATSGIALYDERWGASTDSLSNSVEVVLDEPGAGRVAMIDTLTAGVAIPPAHA